MHVDWDWIKQRPHFLYEELTKIYEVELYFIHKVIDSKAHYVRNTKASNGARKIKKIPFSGRFPILRLIERLLNRRLIKSVTLYDVVWITSPLLLDFIPAEIIKRKIVVYDCMDDFLGFYSGLTGS